MPSRLSSAENFNVSGVSTFFVSGKNRDYYTSENGPGFLPLSITPAGTTVEPGNGYRYHVYFSPATIEVVNGPIEVDYLVVAGGGAGGGHWSPTPATGSLGSGGGGSGGMLNGTTTLASGPYPISVGPGGTGGQFQGGAGGNSALGSIVTTGGGGGGMCFPFAVSSIGPPSFWCQGRPGGSGGGGGTTRSPAPSASYPSGYFAGGSGNTPPTTPSQGNPGGNSGVDLGGAGGGGAGGSGSPSPGGGTAGIARTDGKFAAPLIAPAIPAPLRPTWITAVGDSGAYASGGRGNNATSPQGFLSGGGGAGGGNPGYDYTGGGGAGYGPRPGPHGGFPGGNGGSGLVVFRYLIVG
jgi:hypothetical protein